LGLGLGLGLCPQRLVLRLGFECYVASTLARDKEQKSKIKKIDYCLQFGFKASSLS